MIATWQYLSYFSFFFCSMASNASTSGIPIQSANELNAKGVVPLSNMIEYFHDTHDYSINDVIANHDFQWQVNTNERTNFGQSKDTFWFRFRISDLNLIKWKAFLRLDYVNLDIVKVYYISNDKVFRTYSAGDKEPFHSRPIDERTPLFPLHNIEKSSLEIYIQIKSDGPLEIPLDLVTLDYYQQQEQLIGMWMGAFFGIMILMQLYNLFIYFVLRNEAYLYYILYVATTTVLQFASKGYGFKYLWPESSTLNNQIILSLSAALPMIGLIFSRSFLNITRIGSRTDNALLTIGISIFLTLLALGFFDLYYLVLRLSHMFALLAVVLGLYLGVKYWAKGVKSARIFSLGWFIYFICAILYLLDLTGIKQIHPIMHYSLEFGMIVELVLLSMAFGDRINQEKESVIKLLKTTKQLSLASTKAAACHVSVENIAKMSRNFDLQRVELYLLDSKSQPDRKYQLWKNGLSNSEQIAESIHEGTFFVPATVKDIVLKDKCLEIFIRNNKKEYGYLYINNYDGGKANLSLDLPVIESVIYSLAQTIEAIDAEENKRLSMIGTMAAAIVHDLKNPIGAIQGCAELARMDSIDTAERDKYLSTIVSETNRMKTLAQEVLEYSRGDIVLYKQVVSVDQLLSDLSSTLKPMLESEGIKYHEERNTSVPITLDYDRIHRVILNLANNSRDAMVQQKTKEPRLSLSINLLDDELVITVSDNGPGIPESIKESLFEPFVTHGKADGTGLGMAIVQKIVRAHDGEICFESERNLGTTFTISLPQSKENKVEGDIDRKGLKGISVLLAEDNPVNQMVISKYLEQNAINVSVVFNGKQALEATQNEDFDVILMDIEMPEMDGIEATKYLKSDPVNISTPIIGLTGHSEEKEITKCREAGMIAIVHKPIDKLELEKTILKFLKT
ncbi:MAG: response regulator [Pseudomonadales bacterium]|nr:response regulator [Pseudomonadales bacterium]